MRKIGIILISLLVIILLLLLTTWFIATQPLFFIQKIATEVEVDPSRLQKHVKILSEKFIPRDYQHTDNLDSVASYIMNEFKQTKGRVSQQPYNIDSSEYRNIILQLGPSTEDRIVVGAHYDAFGAFPGADDNASAVAGLIELAHLLDGNALPILVELVAFTLEEPPFFRTDRMGSSVHAASMKSKDISIRMMISLEMIGYFSDDDNSQLYPLTFLKYFYPTTGDWIAVIGDLSSCMDVRSVKTPMAKATELPVYSFNAPPNLVPGIDFSDHLNYWNNDYPAVMVTNTAFNRNQNYHTLHDTADRLDYKRMALVVEGVYAAVLALAQ